MKKNSNNALCESAVYTKGQHKQQIVSKLSKTVEDNDFINKRTHCYIECAQESLKCCCKRGTGC